MTFYILNWLEKCKKIQPIKSTWSTLSTNHMRAFRVPWDPEIEFQPACGE